MFTLVQGFYNYDRLIPGYVFAANKIEAVRSEAARQKVPFVFSDYCRLVFLNIKG